MADSSEPDPVIRELSDLVGKVAIVTGGASGIGRAAALRLALGGASILVADRDEVGGHGTVDLVVDAGGVAQFCAVDVTDPDAIVAMVDDAVSTYGRLDLAVNNAGTSGTYAALGDQTLEDWNRTLAVNLTSVFLSMQAEIAAMLDSGGGSIVNTASGAGLMGFANLPAYVASKHGVVGLTKSVALEFARKGIRVNAVCPGSVRTPMLEGFTGGDEAALQGMGKMQPIGRLGTPDEIAEAIAWLCSDAASFVTGVALPVDGGVMAT
jgi:NAD(P)-dependent dehydrogenase (short-subunit alcohol dehydrogenase family)